MSNKPFNRQALTALLTTYADHLMAAGRAGVSENVLIRSTIAAGFDDFHHKAMIGALIDTDLARQLDGIIYASQYAPPKAVSSRWPST
jgi:hypothetical protein